jgi:hypothetical protein
MIAYRFASEKIYLMVETIKSLDWKPFGENDLYAAAYLMDGTQDQNYVFRTASIVQSAPAQIQSTWVTVDNSLNDGNVRIAYSGVFWTIPAYARQSFKLPSTAQEAVFVLSNLGQCQLFFSNAKLVDDEINRFAIAQYTGSGALFPYETKTASAVQATTDINQVINFVPIADVTYTLLNIGSNSIPNGWYQVIRNGGIGVVSIFPSGGDLINGAGKPITVKPGQTAVLSSDGNAWFARGEYKSRSEVIEVVDFEKTPKNFHTFGNLDFDFILHFEGIYTATDASINGRFSEFNGAPEYLADRYATMFHWHWFRPDGQGIERNNNRFSNSVDFIRSFDLKGGLPVLPLTGKMKFVNCSKPRITVWTGDVIYSANNSNQDIIRGNIGGYLNIITEFRAFRFFTTNGTNFIAGRLTLEKINNRLTDF